MSDQAKVGGILSIISGAFSVFHLAISFFSIYMFRFMSGGPFTPYGRALPDEFLTIMTVFYSAFGLFFVLLGILSIIGGIFALKRRKWGLALAGAIAGTATFFPCGIPAIIFVTLAKAEFSALESSVPAS